MRAVIDNASGDVLFLLDADDDGARFAGAGRTVRSSIEADLLPAARAAQWQLIKAARDAAEWGGVDTAFGRFDSDEASQGKLNGAVTAALVLQAQGAAFEKAWTLADNSSVDLDGPSMIEVGMAVLAWVDAVHQRSRILHARIEAAASVADVNAVQWSLTDD